MLYSSSSSKCLLSTVIRSCPDEFVRSSIPSAARKRFGKRPELNNRKKIFLLEGSKWFKLWTTFGTSRRIFGRKGTGRVRHGFIRVVRQQYCVTCTTKIHHPTRHRKWFILHRVQVIVVHCLWLIFMTTDPGGWRGHIRGTIRNSLDFPDSFE